MRKQGHGVVAVVLDKWHSRRVWYNPDKLYYTISPCSKQGLCTQNTNLTVPTGVMLPDVTAIHPEQHFNLMFHCVPNSLCWVCRWHHIIPKLGHPHLPFSSGADIP